MKILCIIQSYLFHSSQISRYIIILISIFYVRYALGQGKAYTYIPVVDSLTSYCRTPTLGKTRRPLQWRHNGHDSVSNHQPHDYLLNRLFRRISKKTSKLRVTGLCAGSSPGTGEFPAKMASYAENVSIWWRYHGTNYPQHVTIPDSKVHGATMGPTWVRQDPGRPHVGPIWSPVNSPHKGQWRGSSFDVFLICAWINAWVNNREAGDLRRYRAHNDVTETPYLTSTGKLWGVYCEDFRKNWPRYIKTRLQ